MPLIFRPLCLPLILIMGLAFTARPVISSPVCPLQTLASCLHIHNQCAVLSAPAAPIKVDGESLDRVLRSKKMQGYASVLFHASWCPFSRSMLSTFAVLGSMFPQMTHLEVNESSVLPTVYSRYAIHSFPAIVIVNQTKWVRYHGFKNLRSLVDFYIKNTGFEPVQDFVPDGSVGLETEANVPSLPWSSIPREILYKEPYLALSVLFLCLKMFLYFFPRMLSQLKALWMTQGWLLNLAIFGETSQLLGRAFDVVSLKGFRSKMKLSERWRLTDNAKNAQVWASSLTSMSLGKLSSSRPS